MSIRHSAVWGRGQLIVLAGSEGHVLRSEDGGQRWKRAQTPTRQDLSALTGTGAALIAAGHCGTLLSSRDDGQRWSDVGCGATADLRGVALRDDGEAIAVGLGGTVLRSGDHGQTWGAGPSPGDLCLEAAAVDAEGRFLALALEGQLATLQGATWTRHKVPGRSPRALCARGGLVIVGDGDGHAHASRDGGASWESHSTGTGRSIKALWLGAAGVVIASGESGILAVSEDEGRTWRRTALRSDQHRCAAWGDDQGAIWCVGDGPAARSLDGGKSFTKVPVQAGDAPLDGPWEKVPVRGKFRGLWVQAQGRVVLAGDGGTIARTHDGGQTWERSAVDDAGALISVWGSGETILAVGEGASQLRTEDGGRSWIEVAGKPGGASVHGQNETRVFAVIEGRVCRLAAGGSRWLELEVPRAPRLRAVWAGAEQRAVAVGSGGTIVHTIDDGATWEAAESGSSRDLSAIWGRGDELFVAGGLGVSDVLRSRDDGATWEVLAQVSGSLRSLWGDDAGTLWACGARGVLLRSIDGGHTWRGEASGSWGTLFEVRGDGAEAWALGENLLLRRRHRASTD
ncbi:WD40/YVTN/BNR-like repeat-containing protein [Sorangium sp. KYC3313]|uniref:WD40/YVTN/BNR-like repeat-containing protein n=1 Tax=Sorangium sp. KYC3313 TaxID=3449740 RepID=UPI003F8CAB0D